MSDKRTLSKFLGIISELEARFINICNQNDCQHMPDPVTISYDVYNYSKSLLKYNREIFFRGERKMYFVYNDIDASANEPRIRLHSTIGVIEEVMLTDSLLYNKDDGNWYIWSPLDLNAIENLDNPPISQLIELSDPMIERIIHIALID